MILVDDEIGRDCQLIEIIDDRKEGEDVLAVRLEGTGTVPGICIIAVYLSVEGGATELAENKIKLEIIGKILHTHRGEDLILMGDMNGHVGILGEPINKNGELLLAWCENWDMNILNQNSDNGWITWERGDSKSALDMIIANASAAKKDGRVLD